MVLLISVASILCRQLFLSNHYSSDSSYWIILIFDTRKTRYIGIPSCLGISKFHLQLQNFTESLLFYRANLALTRRGTLVKAEICQFHLQKENCYQAWHLRSETSALECTKKAHINVNVCCMYVMTEVRSIHKWNNLNAMKSRWNSECIDKRFCVCYWSFL